MYQKVILIGRIGQVKPSATKTGKTVSQYSLVTTKSYRDPTSGEWNEHSEWHQVVSFNQCADHVNSHLKQGDLIQVEGELRTRKWQDQTGSDRFSTEVIVRDFPKKLPRFYNREGQQPAPTSHGAQQPMPQPSGGYASSLDDFDDDVPF
jgi:single-strand DNA-binding protein